MPISPHCELLLEEPMTRETYYDFRKIRGIVLCKAWQIMEQKQVPFHTAMREAWNFVRQEAAKAGALV